MTPGEAMTLARRRANLKQAAIAAVWGVSTTYVSQVETGKKTFPEDRLGDLPEAVRQPVAEAIANAHERAAATVRGMA